MSAGVDGAVLLWDRAGDRRFVTVRETEGDLLLRSDIGITQDDSFVSPTGAQILSITSAEGENGGFETSMQLVERKAARVWITGLAYLDGGDELLIVALSSVPTQRIDAETLEPRAAPFQTPVTGYMAVPFTTPDSEVVAVVTAEIGADVSGNENQREERLLLINWMGGTVVHDIELGFDGEHAAMSPDGALIAVAGYGGQLAMYDVELGELVPTRVDPIAHVGEQHGCAVGCSWRV